MSIDEERGRCATCGFLALRSDPKEKGEHYWEVDRVRREDGDLFRIKDSPEALRQSDPVCLQGVMSFEDEMELDWQSRHGSGSSRHNKRAWRVALAILKVDRGCSKWREYRPGIGPSLFMQLCMMADMEVERRQWEAGVERARREFEKNMTEQFEQDRRRWEQERSRFDRVILIALLILAVAQVVAAIVD